MSISDDFNKQVDINCSKLIESYRTILSKAVIDDLSTHNEELLLMTLAENIVYNCQSLLDKVHYLKREVVVRGNVTNKESQDLTSTNPKNL